MKQFKGTINGKKLVDFNNFDNKLINLKDRMQFVENNLNHDSFFNEYVSSYYDVSPNQNGYLAEETSVFNLLERLGTYLIEAPDAKSHRKVEYRFWVDEREYNKYKESDNLTESAVNNGTGDNSVEVIDMFVDKKNSKNQKVVKAMTVSKADIKEISEINELEKAIEYLKSPRGIKEVKQCALDRLEQSTVEEEISRLRYIAKNTEAYINKYVSSMRENQLLIKRAIKRPIEFKSILKDEGVPNKLDALDFINSKDVQSLLEFLPQEDLTSEIGILVYDLGKLIESTSLSSRELEIVSMLRDGYKITEMAEELGILKQNVKTYMKRIADKVSKTYEKQVESHRNEIRQKKVK